MQHPGLTTQTGYGLRWALQSRVIIWVAVIVVALAMGVRLFMLINYHAVNILFWDQWDLYTPFFEHQNLWAIFTRQNGPHRQGIGFLFTNLVIHFSHWNSRVDSFAIGGVVYVAMLVALGLKRYLFRSFSFADIAIPIMFLTTAQYETFIGTPNTSHSAFTLLLVMLYCLSWVWRERVWKYVAILVLNFCLIYTGFGFFMGLITPCVFVLLGYQSLRNKNGYLLKVASVSLPISILSLASFFIDYTFAPAVACFTFPYDKPWEYPVFSGAMFDSFARLNGPTYRTPAYIFGIALFLVAMGICVYHLVAIVRKGVYANPISLVIAILLSYGLLFCINAAIGRVCLGLGAAFSSRYITLLIPVFFGLYLHVKTLTNRRLQQFILPLFIIVVLAGSRPLNIGEGHPSSYYSDNKRRWRDCYLKEENIEACDAATGFQIYPYAEGTHLKEKLAFLKQNHLNLYIDSTTHR